MAVRWEAGAPATGWSWVNASMEAAPVQSDSSSTPSIWMAPDALVAGTSCAARWGPRQQERHRPDRNCPAVVTRAAGGRIPRNPFAALGPQGSPLPGSRVPRLVNDGNDFDPLGKDSGSRRRTETCGPGRGGRSPPRSGTTRAPRRFDERPGQSLLRTTPLHVGPHANTTARQAPDPAQRPASAGPAGSRLVGKDLLAGAASQGVERSSGRRSSSAAHAFTNQISLPVRDRNLRRRQAVPEFHHEFDALVGRKIERFLVDFGLRQHRLGSISVLHLRLMCLVGLAAGCVSRRAAGSWRCRLFPGGSGAGGCGAGLAIGNSSCGTRRRQRRLPLFP